MSGHRILWILVAGSLIPGLIFALPEDRFYGGPGDGIDSAVWTQFTGAGGGRRFLGGASDGYNLSRFLQYEPANSLSVYSARFLGGGMDGYSRNDFLQYNRSTDPTLYSVRFVGGPRDGVDDTLASGIPNPFRSGSDGDSLPDWWEAGYYASLLITEGQDTDQDGMDTLSEYLADTDPTDSGSVFRVHSILLGSVAEVGFPSSTGRVYSLYWSTNFFDPVWLPVSGQTQHVGSGGADQLVDPMVVPGFRAYRLDVSIPE